MGRRRVYKCIYLSIYFLSRVKGQGSRRRRSDVSANLDGDANDAKRRRDAESQLSVDATLL